MTDEVIAPLRADDGVDSLSSGGCAGRCACGDGDADLPELDARSNGCPR
jgi:hypothetical protein